mmetsp:Transcript_14474/g.20409  ORF Transcript_14474/g.20409 Transcript_14474/m.20409 type:complete len:1150 (+) Transcript_14474:192-3641(+)
MPSPRKNVHLSIETSSSVGVSDDPFMSSSVFSSPTRHAFEQQQQQQQPILSSSSSLATSQQIVGSPATSHNSFSVPSTSYQHHHGTIIAHSPMESPKSKLLIDTKHKPKTTGSLGIMIVGLSGTNGTTLLSGILANRMKLNWRGPRGEPMEPNYNGCITQVEERGVHGGVGYKGKVPGLANASLAAVGGWDIQQTKLGDALLDAQILDYDLVRQVRGEMNKVKVYRGLYDSRFLVESDLDHEQQPTHILEDEEVPNASEALKCLRADIRYFKWKNGVVGHTTIIWSASNEQSCELVEQIETARELLDAIDMDEDERGGPLPPSLLYATAASLEGCSFVNGGNQNTLRCRGLIDLARQQVGVYCLGTNFKVGQTHFESTAVEYVRTMGMKPKVVVSSTNKFSVSKRSEQNLITDEKKSQQEQEQENDDVFSPWEEDIEHKVSTLHTASTMNGGEKRDFVECTSVGFLGQPHTMVTYTRVSDSILCAPLMIDAAVWCDFFCTNSWPHERVAKATAYLFRTPEGGAKGCDPGFFRQMEELNLQVMAATEERTIKKRNGARRVRIRPEEKATEWALPNDIRIICAGLACVDMQLNQATGGEGGESIETFEGENSIGGGSVSMACKTLGRLCHGAPLDDSFMQVTPPVVNGVVPLCKIGQDHSGDKLLSLLEECGGESRNVETKYIKSARRKDPHARTALAVLPIYEDGRRGCFFDAASNMTFSPWEMKELLQNLAQPKKGPSLDVSQMSEDDFEVYQERVGDSNPSYGAFLFGYPHLLPMLQGDALAEVFHEARSIMKEGGIIGLDLNGVPDGTFGGMQGALRSVSDLKDDPVIGAALDNVDILHMNEDELVLLTGCEIEGSEESKVEDEFAISSAANLFLKCGVAVVAVTRGSKGSFVSCNDQSRFKRSPSLPPSWVDCTAKINAVELPQDTMINTNGAGDAFTSGLLVATMLRHTGMSIKRKTSESGSVTPQSERSLSPIKSPRSPSISPRKAGSPRRQLSPYTLYMREHFVALKQKLKDDKKAIFEMCNKMWEEEADEVKALYERRSIEEAEDYEQENDSLSGRFDTDDSFGSPRSSNDRSSILSDDGTDEEKIRNFFMANRALNLESAVQFASLVAAHHIDVDTRDQGHLDIFRLLDRAMIFPHSLEEI